MPCRFENKQIRAFWCILIFLEEPVIIIDFIRLKASCKTDMLSGNFLEKLRLYFVFSCSTISGLFWALYIRHSKRNINLIVYFWCVSEHPKQNSLKLFEDYLILFTSVGKYSVVKYMNNFAKKYQTEAKRITVGEIVFQFPSSTDAQHWLWTTEP